MRSSIAAVSDERGSDALDLEAALEREELELHYQPVVDLSTREVRSLEALVRWVHPDRGLLQPGSFIVEAEETGLIVPIGKRVLDLATAELARWRRMPGAESLQVSVNISGHQIYSPGLVDDVRGALEATGLPAKALCLEITENVFLGDEEVVSATLAQLREVGVELAIDDFGTGFSSLRYIQRYPFDVLKIDRSFVRGLSESRSGAPLVQAMLTLAEQLSMRPVAEGIENVVELAQLRAMRCQEGQGFLLLRPSQAEVIDELIKDSPGVFVV